MFVLAPADLFSEYRNFMTGLEYCISVLRSRRSKGPVRIELALPADRVSEGMDQRIVRTLSRYCEHRIAYNQRERRAVRLDGLFSLWIGLPIVVLGFLLVIIKSSIVGSTGNANLILDSGGWVLVWVGLWFPLDTLLFTPLSYGRENRVAQATSNCGGRHRATSGDQKPSESAGGPDPLAMMRSPVRLHSSLRASRQQPFGRKGISNKCRQR